MNAKPLFVLILFVLFLALFAGQSIGSTDLTPDTPPAPAAGSTAVQGIYTGRCGPAYTVAQGDTLSRIAQNCGLSVAEILSHNPGLSNPNLIRPGDVLTLYIPTAVPPTPTQATNRAPGGTVPITGLRPGGIITVDIVNFPPLSKVSVLLGPHGGEMSVVKEVQVDESGSYHGNIDIPSSAKAGEKWQIITTSVTNPSLSVSSAPFEIAP